MKDTNSIFRNSFPKCFYEILSSVNFIIFSFKGTTRMILYFWTDWPSSSLIRFYILT